MEKWQKIYKMGWATKEQLKKVVVLGEITAEEYETITGEVHVQ